MLGVTITTRPPAAERPHPHLLVFALALVPFYLWFAYEYAAHSTGIVDPTGHAVGRDFINLWTAGRLAREGRAATIFDVTGFHTVQEEVLGRPFPLHLWSYPPHFLFFVAPLGLLNYLAAFVLWSVLTTALYVWAAVGPRPAPMLLLALAPATIINVVCGQTGALAAALFFGGLRLLPARPIGAGILFGLLTIKPQLGLLLPLVLLLQRRWTAIASAIATTAGLVALSALVFGPASWGAYFHQNLAVTRGYMEHGRGLFMLMSPSSFMAMRLFGAPLWAAYAVQGVSTAVAAVGCVLAWRSPAPLEQKIAVTGLATLLATPYAHNYDMTFVSVAVLLGYQLGRTRESGSARALLAIVWLLPLAMMPLHAVRLIVAPWLLIGFFVWFLNQLGAFGIGRGSPIAGVQ